MARAIISSSSVGIDFERRRLSVLVDAPDGHGRRLLLTKGACEPIVGLSIGFEARGQVTPLDQATRGTCAAEHERLSAD